MPTLTSLEADLLALDEILSELGGDVTDQLAANAIDAWLAENEENLRQKLDAYCYLIQHRQELADARNADAKRLRDLAKVDENIVARLKDRLKYHLAVREERKVSTTHFEIGIQNNGGKTPVIQTDDTISPAAWADDPELGGFVRVKYELDMDAIRHWLENHGKVPGFILGDRGTHLRIR